MACRSTLNSWYGHNLTPLRRNQCLGLAQTGRTMRRTKIMNCLAHIAVRVLTSPGLAPPIQRFLNAHGQP